MSSGLRYVLKRLAVSLFLLAALALIIYCLLRALPSSYVEQLARERASQPGAMKSYGQWLAQLNAVYGLDQGLLRGFFTWMGQACQGNFGDSWYYGLPVTEKFGQVIGYSLVLAGGGLLLEVGLALPLGMVAAQRRYTWTDFLLSLAALLSLSLPVFFLAAILKLVFALELNWLPLFGAAGRDYLSLSGWARFWDQAQHFILPLLTFALVGAGSLLRFTRGNMLEALDSDYYRAARAAGLTEGRLLWVHGLPNILLPLLTLAGGALPTLFAGALVIEVLFQIPGIGWTAYQAMLAGDIPFSLFYLLLLAAATLGGSFLADLLYALADPRIRREGVVNRG